MQAATETMHAHDTLIAKQIVDEHTAVAGADLMDGQLQAELQVHAAAPIDTTGTEHPGIEQLQPDPATKTTPKSGQHTAGMGHQGNGKHMSSPNGNNSLHPSPPAAAEPSKPEANAKQHADEDIDSPSQLGDGLRQWWQNRTKEQEQQHQNRSRSRSRSRERRHRSVSPKRHHHHRHGHHHHHHNGHEKRRSRSRSRSPTTAHHNGAHHHHRHSQDKDLQLPSKTIKVAVQTGHIDAAALPSSSGGATPTRRVVHESTLVDIQSSIVSPRSAFPISAFEIAAEMLQSPRPPSPGRKLELAPMVFGAAQAKGMRPYMEDRHIIVEPMVPRGSSGAPMPDDTPRSFAAVYDGHNGTLAADHAADRLHFILAAEPALRTCTGQGPPAVAHRESERMASALVHAFETTDREILHRCRIENGRGGATGVVVLRVGETLYAAHCGDSRAVMCRRGEPLRLTEDHKPNLPRERKRVEDLGGRVDFARCWRVIVDPGDGRPASGLAVSRSFGDPDFKDPLHLVIATPDVMSERLTSDDSFVVLASDGLWDVMSDKEACDVVAAKIAAAEGSANLTDELVATIAAEALVQTALDNGTMDNITAVVGLLKWT